MKKAILLFTCKDQPGIVAAISHFIFSHQGNIVDSDQHTDFETGTFFIRIEWELDRFTLSRAELALEIEKISQKFLMNYKLVYSDRISRMAIFVSKYGHCLYDLLIRRASGEFEVEIPLIVSNHPDLKAVADHFKIPFHVIAVHADNKIQAEQEQLKLLKKHQIDLIILARYMQVLSPRFIKIYPNRMINIHHSFLPAFSGGRPYHQAYAKGVKVIGATSHYVTEIVDEGPIIEQTVTRVSHKDRVEDLVRKGRDQEKIALAYAVRMHLEHRILTYGNKTIVFD